MIYSLRGTVVHTEPNMIVVECGGVGYQCSTTNQTIAKLPKEQKQVLIYTYLQVREDAVNLFGFYDLNELSCFKMLISVSGVGPKAALNILSSSTPEALAMAILAGDEKALTVAPGIGKKIAQRVIYELKDKIAKESGGAIPAAAQGGIQAVSPGADKLSDAAAALGVLGYGAAEINSA